MDGGLLRLTTGTRSWLFGRSWRVLVDRVVYVSDEDLEPEERLRSTLGLAASGYGRPSPLTEDRWLRLGADVVVEAFDDGRAAAVAADLRYCRVCGLRHDSPPWGPDGASPTYGLCACCGVQFGYEDLIPDAVEGYRQLWACSGARWHQAALRPSDWSAEEQLRAIPAPFVVRSDGTVPADRRLAAVEGGVLLAAIQAFCRRADRVTVRLPSGWFGRQYDDRHAMTNGYVEDGRAVVEFDRRFTLAVGGATVLGVSRGVLPLEGFTSATWVWPIRAGEAPRDERFDGGCIELHS